MPDVLQGVTAFPPRAVLTPKVHRVLGLNPTPFTGPGTNTYLVGMDGADPLLLDTGVGVPAWQPLLVEHLAQHGVATLRRCVMTHGHADHQGGVPQLRALFPQVACHKHPWPARDPADAGYLRLDGGDVVRGDGYTLHAIATPGHAPDHLCFLLEEEGALFTGDVILGVGTTVIPLDGGDLGQYLQTLRTLLALAEDGRVRRIYPGHGPVIDDPEAKIREYLEHRLARERQILEALAGGEQTVPQLVATIYAAYPANLHAAAGQSVTSHLLKLEQDGRVTRDTAEPPAWARVD